MGALRTIGRYLLPRRQRVRPALHTSIDRAIEASDDLIARMRSSSLSGDAVRGIMANLWEQRHNVPYLTTMYEADQEMTAAVDARRKSGGG